MNSKKQKIKLTCLAIAAGFLFAQTGFAGQPGVHSVPSSLPPAKNSSNKSQPNTNNNSNNHSYNPDVPHSSAPPANNNAHSTPNVTPPAKHQAQPVNPNPTSNNYNPNKPVHSAPSSSR